MEMKCGRRDFMRGGAAFFVAAGLGNAVFGKDAGPARLRIGIGHDFALGGQIDYVLGSLSEEQLQELPGIARTVAGGLRTWAFLGVQKAMSQLNSRIKTEKTAIED